MSRIIKILGIAVVLTVILVVAFAGSVFAAGGNPDQGNQGEECPYGPCACGDCEPKDNNYDYSYGEPGPHGPQHGKNSE